MGNFVNWRTRFGELLSLTAGSTGSLLKLSGYNSISPLTFDVGFTPVEFSLLGNLWRLARMSETKLYHPIVGAESDGA